MTDTVEVYDIATDTWSAGPAMPAVVAPYGGGDLGFYMVAFAAQVSNDGVSTTYTCAPEAYMLNTMTATWSQVADLPRCLYGTDGVSDGLVFYDISGRTNEGSWHMALENQVSETCGTVPVELMHFIIE
jgi:hypothetical protein